MTRWSPGRVGALEGPALAKVLDQTGTYRPLFELLAFTGLRIGEALGLTWADVDLDAGLLSVHRQLSRYREHAKLKTEAGRRQIVLAPAMVRLLRSRWLASAAKGPDDFVFLNRAGRPLDYRKVGRRSASPCVDPGSVAMGDSRSTASATATPRSSSPRGSTWCSCRGSSGTPTRA